MEYWRANDVSTILSVMNVRMSFVLVNALLRIRMGDTIHIFIFANASVHLFCQMGAVFVTY